MKTLSALLCAAAVALVGGCNSAGSYKASALQPAIILDGPKQVSIGEQQRLIAHTHDTAGARNVQWLVEPSTARITPEGNSAGQTAMFSATQRGRYIVTARVEMGNGMNPVESSTTIDVVGGPPTASDRMPEPAPRP